MCLVEVHAGKSCAIAYFPAVSWFAPCLGAVFYSWDAYFYYFLCSLTEATSMSMIHVQLVSNAVKETIMQNALVNAGTL